MRTTILALLAGAMILSAPPPALAHGPEGRDQEGRAERIHERMAKKRSRVLRERVGLDEAKASEVETTLAKFDERRRQIHVRKRAVRKTVRQLLEADSDDQAAFEAALREMQAVHDGIMALRKEQMAALARTLSAKQQVKLMLAMRRMDHRMKDMMVKRRGRRDSRRGEGRRHRRGGPRGDE